jgi:hypothetical protein
MFRVKTLSILAGMVAVLAISVTPGSAWWESNSSNTTGKVKVIATGRFVDAGSKVECPNIAEVEEHTSWWLQTKGQIKKHQQNGEQLLTTAGPHLYIQVKNWGACKAEISGTTLEAKVSACEFQLVQTQKGSLTATGGSVNTCVITTEICVLQIPAAMEKAPGSNEGINVGLKEISLENNAAKTNQIDRVNIKSGGTGQLAGEGIMVQRGSGSKTLCPISSNEEGELLGLEFEALGIKAA